MTQVVQAVGLMGADGAGRGRGTASGRYRGRHRKPRALGRTRAGVRAGVMMACAGLFLCWPQASWADHANTATAHSAHAHAAVSTRARTTVASHLTARNRGLRPRVRQG